MWVKTNGQWVSSCVSSLQTSLLLTVAPHNLIDRFLASLPTILWPQGRLLGQLNQRELQNIKPFLLSSVGESTYQDRDLAWNTMLTICTDLICRWVSWGQPLTTDFSLQILSHDFPGKRIGRAAWPASKHSVWRLWSRYLGAGARGWNPWKDWMLWAFPC